MITVTGSLAFDHIMDFDGVFADHIMPDRLHQINLSFLLKTLQKQRGGTAGNIAYNLSLLKSPVSIVGIAGSDFLEYEKYLKSAGVDTSQIKITNNSLTSSAFIMTDKKDNQITGFYPGAMEEASSLSLQGIDSNMIIISPNNPKAMVKFALQCNELKIKYMLDPGMQLPALDSQDLKSMVEGAEILIGNDYEIALLSDKLQVTSDKLLEYVKILITTKGNKGSQIQTSINNYNIEAGKPMEVLDPTGAGDAFRGGFLAGYQKGLDLKVCGQMGSITACYAVEKYGTTNHRFSLEEFTKRYEENFGEELNI